MDTQIKITNNNVAEIKEDITEIKIDINGIEKDITEMKTDISGMESSISGIEKDITEMKTGISTLTTTLTDFANQAGVITGSERRRNETSQSTISIVNIIVTIILSIGSLFGGFGIKLLIDKKKASKAIIPSPLPSRP